MLISLESFWTDRKEVLINVNSVDVCGSVPALGNFDCPCSEHSVVVGLRAVWGCWWRGRAAYTEAAAAAALVAVAVPVGEDENEHRDQLLSVNIWGKYLDWWNCSGSNIWDITATTNTAVKHQQHHLSLCGDFFRLRHHVRRWHPLLN